jgi:hypothetical protein
MEGITGESGERSGGVMGGGPGDDRNDNPETEPPDATVGEFDPNAPGGTTADGAERTEGTGAGAPKMTEPSAVEVRNAPRV